MTNHLGKYIRRQRERQGLSRGDVARAMGRRNVSKAARRRVDLEGGQGCPGEFWEALRAVLSFDDADIAHAVQLDREAYERWLDEPVEMLVIVRLLPAVCLQVELPPDAVVDPVKSEAFACQTAREWSRKVCLVVSRRLRVWIDSTGKVTGRGGVEGSAPSMAVGAKQFLLRTG